VTGAELEEVLERAVRGDGPTAGIGIYGAIKREAQRLLDEWRHPDRDARNPYTF
jgi:hypothetical protein